MTPPIDYIILDYNQSGTYYKYDAGKTYNIFRGVGKIYNRFRYHILDVRGATCSQCGRSGNIIHHIKSVNKNPNLYYCYDNIDVLCKECHKETHRCEGY